jgi:small subunit ribosomal protein S2
MSETPDPSTPATTPEAPPETIAAAMERTPPSVRGLLEAGAHVGHQTRRWNPKMKRFIFGERAGIHIIDLDQTVQRLATTLDFLRETVAAGGKVLFVATKRQAQDIVQREAERCAQYYVNNRWLGGMLTNFRTVRKSIERFKEQLAVVADEEKVKDLSKKDLSRLNRSITKYKKSLDGIQEMSRLPDAMFVIDVGCEHIAVSEARRLGIPIAAVVDTNGEPEGIDFVIPGNDDAIRAIELYVKFAADACLEGAELFNARVQAQEQPAAAGAEGTGPRAIRRVVEIRHPTARRGRQPGGTHSALGRARRGAPAPAESEAAAPAEAPAPPDAPASAEAAPASAEAAPATPEAPAAEPAAAETTTPAAEKPSDG